MKRLLKLVFVGLVAGCATTPDPVDVKVIGEVACPTNLNSCTAKDVTTIPVSVIPYAGDTCESFNDQIIFDITIRFTSTADSRYDLGFYLSSDGKQLQNAGPLTAKYCLGDAPQIGEGNANASISDCDTDLFLGLDNTGHTNDPDTCGDLDAKAGPVEITMRVNVSCSTVTPDFTALIVPSCRVWEQNANHKNACKNLSQAGTGSKCDCDPLVLRYPTIDPCLFRNCDDDNYCTIDICSVVNGVPICDHLSEETKPCVDGRNWTSNDMCINSNCTGNPDPPQNFSCYTHICDLSGCYDVNFEDGTSCDDGVFCTVGDVCLGGVCTGGPALICNASTECKQAYCDYGQAKCVETNRANGTACGNTTVSECDNADTCDGNGNCLANYEPSTTICNTTSANQACEDVRYCSGTGICPPEGPPKVNRTLCRNSTEACDPPEYCDGIHLGCPELPALVCNDGLTCTVDKCVNGLYCDYTEPVVCYDENACTNNACTEPNGCAFTTIECTSNGNICQTPICDNTTGCGFINNEVPCDDGNFCTLNDNCANGNCVGGSQKVCNLGKNEIAACVEYNCNPTDGNCIRTLHDGASCTTSNLCLVDTTCSNGRCTVGNTRNCSDGHICTDDLCSTANGGCFNKIIPETANYFGCPIDKNECILFQGCNGVNRDCVTTYKPNGTMCFNPLNAGGNDGINVNCFTDTCQFDVQAGGSICKRILNPIDTICDNDPPADSCQLKSTCDLIGNCVKNNQPTTFVCRNVTDICDLPEYCAVDVNTGSGYCPENDVHDVNKLCRTSTSFCTKDTYCDGSSPTCPVETYQANTVPCSAANLSITNCQSGGYCSGTNGTCIIPPAKNCNDDNSCTVDNCTIVSGQAQCSNAGVPGQTCCGCTYTKGYWGSSRFSNWPRKNTTTSSVENTCTWPVSPYQCTGTTCVHLESKTLNCLISNKPVTYWTVIHTSIPPLKTINTKWWLAAQQAIALQLNILNGLCAVGCTTNAKCDNIRSFFNVDVLKFLGPNSTTSGQICTVSDKTVIGSCGAACQALCVGAAIPSKSCTMAVVAEIINSGNTSTFPEHCQNPDLITSTRRGCCASCNCYAPACSPQIIQYQSIEEVASEPTEEEKLTLEEEIDIVIMTFVIVGAISSVIGLVVVYIAMCKRGPYAQVAGAKLESVERANRFRFT